MVQRVLVGAQNFGTALLPGQQIKRGDTVEVSQEVAEKLDVFVRMDIANNAHPVFVEPDHKLAAPYVDQADIKPAKKKAVKKRAAPRRKKTA